MSEKQKRVGFGDLQKALETRLLTQGGGIPLIFHDRVRNILDELFSAFQELSLAKERSLRNRIQELDAERLRLMSTVEAFNNTFNDDRQRWMKLRELWKAHPIFDHQDYGQELDEWAGKFHLVLFGEAFSEKGFVIVPRKQLEDIAEGMILGRPAVFAEETEFEKGYEKGYYDARDQVKDRIKELLEASGKVAS